MFKASKGGNKSWIKDAILTKTRYWNDSNKEIKILKLWLIKYTIIVIIIVNIGEINVEKNNTNPIRIKSFNTIKKRENNTKISIGIFFKNKTQRNKSDCKKVIIKITPANHKNFHTINSYLWIGLLKIKKIVFHSISLNKSWLPTNKTQIIPKISMSAIQKSKITLSDSPIVSFHKETERIIKSNAKTRIRYKNLFLIISFKVLTAIFHIKILK